MQGQIIGVIFAFDSEAGASHPVDATQSFGQTAYECSFAAAQVTDQLNCLAAFKISADFLA